MRSDYEVDFDCQLFSVVYCCCRTGGDEGVDLSLTKPICDVSCFGKGLVVRRGANQC